MKLEEFKTPGAMRLALKFGAQKINVHEWARSSSRARTSPRRVR